MNTKNRRMLVMTLMIVFVLALFGAVIYTSLATGKMINISHGKELLAMYVQGDNGEYTLSDSRTFPTEGYELNTSKSSCTNGGLLSQNSETKKINATISNTDSCVLYFDKEVFNVVKAVNAIKNDQKPSGTNGVRTEFDKAATTDEGVFEMEDDYGTSYYYRGAVTNNYVKFADFYWRIIRVNGDGSLRMIYDGTSAHKNGEDSTDRFTHIGQVYNANYADNKYVGWMYGPAGTTASTSKNEAQTNTVSSDIKKVVDSWYKTNIMDKGYSDAVSDILFCNDRSTPGQSSTGWSSDTGLGYGRNMTAFGAVARTGVWNSATTKSSPKFKCPQKNDAFTVSDTSKGNGALTYPIGLITADEIVTAGSGKFVTTNSSYYLYRSNKWYWSFSPSICNTDSGVFLVEVYGSLSDSYVGSDSGAVAPVINLSAEYVSEMVGSGIMTDPYRAPDVTV